MAESWVGNIRAPPMRRLFLLQSTCKVCLHIRIEFLWSDVYLLYCPRDDSELQVTFQQYLVKMSVGTNHIHVRREMEIAVDRD